MQMKILTLIGAIAIAGSAIAAGPERPRRAADESLGLTAEQRAKIKTLRTDFQKAKIRHQADRRIAQLELQELLTAATIDEEAVRVKVRQLTELQAAALKANVEHRLAVSKILTPEQRAKRAELRAHRKLRGRHGARMGRRFMRAHRQGPGAEPRGDAGMIEEAEPQPDTSTQ